MSDTLSETLADKDKRYVWHPFTQMQDYQSDDPLIIERGDGLFLYDVEGRAYYDSISSIWLNVHGHRVPEIDQAIRDQLGNVAHSTLLGHANVPSILLAERLAALTPKGLDHVFYSDSGSESVEIGLKMAYQYWRHQGEDGRRLFIAMTNAYHGDTIGAVSAGGIDQFHAAFRDLLFPTLRAPYPHPYRFDGSAEACREAALATLRELLEAHHEEVCGLILEPMIAGAAGMLTMPPGFLRGAEALCREYGILLLTDEVATGFGRTGRLFACEHEGVTPDIMMMAKGITGGYLPLAATVANDRVYDAFLGDYEEMKTFFHGHSYTGNQLACAAALANLDLFRDRDLVAAVTERSPAVEAELRSWLALPHVGDVRGMGLMWGIELIKDKAAGTDYDWRERIAVQVCNRCRELGMISRPLGNVLIFMPPLASGPEDLAAMLEILRQATVEITGD